MKCPKCGNEVKFLEKHNMYFCESCNKYYYAKAPETKSAEAQNPELKKEEPEKELICPNCLSNEISYNAAEEKYICADCGKKFYKRENGRAVITKCPSCNSIKFVYDENKEQYICEECAARFDSQGKRIIKTAKCPNCGSHDTKYMEEDEFNYCMNCGKSFDGRTIVARTMGQKHYPYDAGFWLGVILNGLGILICKAAGRNDAIRGAKKGLILSIILDIIAIILTITLVICL